MDNLLNDKDLRNKLLTEEGKTELLGESKGVAFSMKGRREVPQTLYEFGFICHDTVICGGYEGGGSTRRPIERVIFDGGPYKGRSVDI